MQAGAIYLLLLTKEGEADAALKIGSGAGGFTAPLSAYDFFGCAIALLGDLDGLIIV